MLTRWIKDSEPSKLPLYASHYVGVGGLVLNKKKDKILDHRRDILVDAELVVLTFEFQKNDERDRRVHMFGTDEGMMCPVIA